ncbi:MAG TPA: protein kinase [Kofleriaceae bacterium]
MTSGDFAAGLVGIVLDDRYRLDALLGEGGMGSVFRAQHLAMDRRVAVKLLKPHLTQDEIAAQRFLREARSTMKVESPHAVKVLDFGVTPHGDYYMALEYLDGRTVQRELEIDGPFAPSRVLHITRHALHALGAAHKIGLIHRDIKPDNILLMRVGTDADYAKLLDFGVAKLMEGTASESGSHDAALTQVGMVFGTPEYMSPEQACGHVLDPRSDIYSLAATMFAMLTGCAMFEAKAPIEMLSHHVRTPPPHLEALQPELAQFPKLDELLQRCLAKHREQRPASAEELDQLLAELEVYVERGGAAAKPRQGLRSGGLGASDYFQALPADVSASLPAVSASGAVAKNATLPAPGSGEQPRAPSAPVASLASGSQSVVASQFPVEVDAPLDDDLPLTSKRTPLLVVGGLALLGMIYVAMLLVMRGGPSTKPDVPVVKHTEHAVVADAAVVAEVEAPIAADAAVTETPPVKSTTPKKTPAIPTAPADSTHLKAAEQAQRDDNRLKQLAEADQALQADPKNARAKYLLADALIKTGDVDRGCTLLKGLGRYPLAIARANAAQCPK